MSIIPRLTAFVTSSSLSAHSVFLLLPTWTWSLPPKRRHGHLSPRSLWPTEPSVKGCCIFSAASTSATLNSSLKCLIHYFHSIYLRERGENWVVWCVFWIPSFLNFNVYLVMNFMNVHTITFFLCTGMHHKVNTPEGWVEKIKHV